jgi:hypothetical protein
MLIHLQNVLVFKYVKVLNFLPALPLSPSSISSTPVVLLFGGTKSYL